MARRTKPGISGQAFAPPAYIFDPDVVAEALACRPHLRETLGHLTDADPALNFAMARRSTWQMARLLGAADRFPRLLRLADDFEQCLRHGLRLEWLTTNSRVRLRSGLAEVAVACELLRHGFRLQDLDHGKRQNRVPELAARRGDLEVAVEVYAPRAWEPLADLTDALVDHLRHLDRPLDYAFELNVRPAAQIGADGWAIAAHPATPSDGLRDNPAVKHAVIRAIVGEIDLALSCGRTDASASASIPDLNLGIDASVADVRAAGGLVPRRRYCASPWPASGYAPESLFSQVLRRPVRRKMRRAQAVSAGLASAMLVVDLSNLPIVDEWAYEHYADRFRDAIEAYIAPSLERHDVIAFCDTSGPDGGLRVRRCVAVETAPSSLVATVEAMGGHIVA